MRCPVFGLLLGFFVARTSIAYNWIPVGDGGEGNFLVHIDAESIEPHDGHIRVLEKYNYYKPIRYAGGKTIRVIKSSQSYDCDKRTHLLLHGLAYSDSEGQIAIGAIKHKDAPENYEPVIPRSGEEKILELVCHEPWMLRKPLGSTNSATMVVE